MNKKFLAAVLSLVLILTSGCGIVDTSKGEYENINLEHSKETDTTYEHVTSVGYNKLSHKTICPPKIKKDIIKNENKIHDYIKLVKKELKINKGKVVKENVPVYEMPHWPDDTNENIPVIIDDPKVPVNDIPVVIDDPIECIVEYPNQWYGTFDYNGERMGLIVDLNNEITKMTFCNDNGKYSYYYKNKIIDSGDDVINIKEINRYEMFSNMDGMAIIKFYDINEKTTFEVKVCKLCI